MNDKNIAPLNDQITPEESASFSNKQAQHLAQSIYPQNVYRDKLAEETNAILRQRLKKDIRDEIAKMRKSMFGWLFILVILFFFAGVSQQTQFAAYIFLFTPLLIPIYFYRRRKIIKSYTDDSPIK
jgi:hypothetical protein